MYKWCSAKERTADKVADSPPAYRNFHTQSRGLMRGWISLLAYINFIGFFFSSLSLSCCCFWSPTLEYCRTVPPEGGAAGNTTHEPFLHQKFCSFSCFCSSKQQNGSYDSKYVAQRRFSQRVLNPLSNKTENINFSCDTVISTLLPNIDIWIVQNTSFLHFLVVFCILWSDKLWQLFWFRIHDFASTSSLETISALLSDWRCQY